MEMCQQLRLLNEMVKMIEKDVVEVAVFLVKEIVDRVIITKDVPENHHQDGIVIGIIVIGGTIHEIIEIKIEEDIALDQDLLLSAENDGTIEIVGIAVIIVTISIHPDTGTIAITNVITEGKLQALTIKVLIN